MYYSSNGVLVVRKYFSYVEVGLLHFPMKQASVFSLLTGSLTVVTGVKYQVSFKKCQSSPSLLRQVIKNKLSTKQELITSTSLLNFSNQESHPEQESKLEPGPKQETKNSDSAHLWKRQIST